MRDWITSLVHGRLLELALALAVGAAAAALADTTADIGIGLFAQHFGHVPFGEEGGTNEGVANLIADPYLLNFTIGSTVIFYGEVLSALLAVGLVALTGLFVVRKRDRELGTCPFCASRIPHGSSHCAYCGSTVEAGGR